ncbi:translation initiation factor IF-2 subunit alpha [Candidatus Woesearchaeota archaeon]|nr:translation initiation factor IF-2 subunit alpha [Candidatus Woesearchaeota archaeon]
MLLKKKGLPEEDELVLCTVTKIFPNGVFALLEEYGQSGMIHISEVSPGRIRNIRDFVKEGKKIVCKVLRINKEKGQIDLSLRRVNDGQKRGKLNEIKLEQKAEKIIEHAAKKIGKSTADVFKEIFDKVSKKYGLVYPCFDEVVQGKASLEKLGVSLAVANVVEEAVRERLKPPEVSVQGDLKVRMYSPEGIVHIKKALEIGEAGKKTKTNAFYLGGGRYHIVVNAEEYKDAEKILDKFVESAVSLIKKCGGSAEFSRTTA